MQRYGISNAGDLSLVACMYTRRSQWVGAGISARPRGLRPFGSLISRRGITAERSRSLIDAAASLRGLRRATHLAAKNASFLSVREALWVERKFKHTDTYKPCGSMASLLLSLLRTRTIA